MAQISIIKVACSKVNFSEAGIFLNAFPFLLAIRCHDCTGTNCPSDIVNKWSGKCQSAMGKCFIRKDPNGGKFEEQ